MTILASVNNKTLMPGITPIADVPDRPTIGTATAAGLAASITFTAATTGGTATTFTATSSPGSLTGTASSSPITVSGLTEGTSYTFTVTAGNSTGTSPASSASNSITAVSPLSGGYDSLATVIVPSGGLSSATFAGIPAGYKHLQIRILGRTDSTGNRTATFLQFNGDTASNYRWHGLAGSGSAISGEEAGSAVGALRIGSSNLPMGDAGSNIFGVSVADILDYSNVSKNKVTRALAGADQNDTTGRMSFVSGIWLNTAAVTTIKVYPEGANWAQHSSIALYGVK